MKLSEEELLTLPEIGQETARAVVSFLSDPAEVSLIKSLLERGFEISAPKEARGSRLCGKTFVITGTLESMSRKEAEERITALSGKVSSSVSRSTDYVVVGADPGSKYEKAKSLGVPMLSEKEFLELLQAR